MCKQLTRDLQEELNIREFQAASCVDILAKLEVGALAKRCLNQAAMHIESASSSDAISLPDVVNFGRVPRSLITRLRRCVELVDAHTGELPNELRSSMLEVHAMLEDFARWQPYARFSEHCNALSRIGTTGPLEKLFTEAEIAISTRPASMSNVVALGHLTKPFETALTRRLDTLIRRTETLPLDTLHATVEAFRADVEELRSLQALLDRDAFSLALSDEGCSRLEQIQVQLRSISAWECERKSVPILKELARSIQEKTAAQVLVKLRHTSPNLVALGVAKPQVASFIAESAQVMLLMFLAEPALKMLSQCLGHS
jgi:hypothetical protein